MVSERWLVVSWLLKHMTGGKDLVKLDLVKLDLVKSDLVKLDLEVGSRSWT